MGEAKKYGGRSQRQPAHLAGHIYVRPDSFLGKFVSVVYLMDMHLTASISFFPYADKRNLFTKLPWILQKFCVNVAEILQ